MLEHALGTCLFECLLLMRHLKMEMEVLRFLRARNSARAKSKLLLLSMSKPPTATNIPVHL